MTKLNIKLDGATNTLLQQAEARVLEAVYQQSRYNQLQAAKALGISRGAFRYKLQQYFGDKYIYTRDSSKSA